MKNSVLIIVLILTSVVSCSSDPELNTLAQKIDYIVKPYLYSGSRVGVAIGIYDKGEQHFFFYGTRDIEKGGKIDENTQFEIGSVTKSFTSVVFAEMEAEGKLNRNDLLQKFVPKHVNVPTFGNIPISLLHLSNQTSALPYMPDDFDKRQLPPPFDTYSEENLFSFLSNYKLSRAPGELYEYSNIGPAFLGYVLQQQDKLDYFTMVKNRILDPIGMINTGIEFNDSTEANIAKGYLGKMKMYPWNFNNIWAGSGALKSNLKDMMKYLEAHLSNTSDKLHLAMRETHQMTFSGEYDMGLSWFILNNNKPNSYCWHNGGTGGYSSFMGFDHENKKGLVILTNSQSGQENEISMALEIKKVLDNL